MTRGADPEGIYQSQRAGVIRRLVDSGRVDEVDAERWVSRWEAEASDIGPARGSQESWDFAWQWIEDEREASDPPKTDMSAVGDGGQVFGG
jgi:hypothetical protein